MYLEPRSHSTDADTRGYKPAAQRDDQVAVDRQRPSSNDQQDVNRRPTMTGAEAAPSGKRRKPRPV
jgi:hypothetical protein